ncbi:baseplate hub protein [Brevundimonas subvibrioides]|uniref:baseplate hub domain-containing protein n=1 Tax=Brevundimonas subvibrioides TaxID=74313 RepID=UPI0022B56A60|nr:DUF2163 domain-containing protein [Brevundimonas subvibrioides]
MRDIPTELAARIESGAATLCHAWIVVRTDGARMGFTDHDRGLEVDGVVCAAGSGWTQGATDASAGLGGGTLAVAGVLDDDRITAADVAAGLWDRARVEVWRVDWRRPDLKVRLGVGTFSRIRREGAGFTAEVEGPLAALERVVGRTYGRACDAVLGDRRCRVDPAGRACDKRWETCVGVFGNGINFQGFPRIPGDDFLTAYPATGGRNDGGKR